MRRLLLLGGTLEARQIAAALAGGQKRFEATLSLAGVTSNPPDPGIPVRTGGFGGVEGLAEYLAENEIKMLVDATHPFAAQISANAEEACREAGVERLTLWRPAWTPLKGDNWREFNRWPELVAELEGGARVFMAAGQDGIKAIAADPRLADGRITCFARAIEVPPEVPHGVEFIKSRPAKTWQEEAELFQEKNITHLVAKNSGGEASRAKIDAARQLGLPVLLLARPAPPAEPLYETTEDILAALNLPDHGLKPA